MWLNKMNLRTDKGALLRLHINIMIFSFTGILSKLAAESISSSGIWSIRTLLLIGLIGLNCGIYAIFWQQNLKSFAVNVAYAHSAVYNVWSILWAVLIFHEAISPGNIIGTVLIILGIWEIRSE